MRLLAGKSFTALVLPNFSWKILNYGRVLNNVRYQDTKFQETVLQYQQTVLTAGREVEDALVAFLQYQLQARSLEESVKEAEDSVELVQAQYRGGLVDFNRVFTTQAQLVTQQDELATARGNIALSLILRLPRPRRRLDDLRQRRGRAFQVTAIPSLYRH